MKNSADKLKIRIVDGTEVRNKHFTDFTQAVHDAVYQCRGQDE